MRVVSNASPLIFLSKLGELDLLEFCFSEINIPEAVRIEIGDLPLPSFVQVKKISEFGRHYVAGAVGTLHVGELEAMVLAKEIEADLVLLDDLRSRRKAERMGLKILGTIGLLKLASAKGGIKHEKLLTHYDALVEQHGMWLSDKIIKKIKAF